MCTGSHAFIGALNTAKVDVVQLYDEQTVVNSFYFQKDGGWNESDIRNLADAAGDSWVANFLPVQVSALTIQLVRATDVSVDNSWQTEDATHAGAAGGLLREGLPGGSALVVKQTTGHTGRSFRGRSYICGLDEQQVTRNQVDGSYRNDIVSAFIAFIDDVETTMECTHVVASYCQNGSWLSTAQLTEITGYSADIFVDSQRRRLTGRGV